MFKLMDEEILILLSNIGLILTHVLAPRTIKLFPCSSQLSRKFIMLINVKMPTIFQSCRDISLVEPVLAEGKVLAQGQKTVPPLKFEPETLRSQVPHSTTKSLCCSLMGCSLWKKTVYGK